MHIIANDTLAIHITLSRHDIQGGPKKTAHGFHCNNFVYSQPIFIILGLYNYTAGNLQLEGV